MNYILLKLNSAPCIISADDRLAYFGALDAFHQEGGLAPFIDFCRIQTLNTWEHLLQVGPSQLLPLFLAKVAIVSTLGVRTVTWTAAYAASPNRLLRLSIVS